MTRTKKHQKELIAVLWDCRDVTALALRIAENNGNVRLKESYKAKLQKLITIITVEEKCLLSR